MANFTSRDALFTIVSLLLAAVAFACLGSETLAFGCVTAAAALASPGSGSMRTGTTLPPPTGGVVQGPLQDVRTPRHRRRTPVAGVPVVEGKEPL
jgi:hypothetical protein